MSSPQLSASQSGFWQQGQCPSSHAHLPPRWILRKPGSRFPREPDTYRGMEQITDGGRAKLWCRRTSGKKPFFWSLPRATFPNTPGASPHRVSLPVSEKQSVAGFALLPTTPAHSLPASASQPSASQLPHLTRTSPPLMAALEQRSRGYRAACRLTPGPSGLFGSASSGVREPGRAVRPPRRTRSPGGAQTAAAWDSPGPGGCPRWAAEHRERGGVW